MTQPGQPACDEAGPAGAGPVVRVTTAQEMLARIALVVPIEQLEAALAVIREFLPAEQNDADLAWRAELTSRFASVRGLVELLAETVPWGGTDAGTPVIAALRALPRVLAYGKHAGARHIEALRGPGHLLAGRLEMPVQLTGGDHTLEPRIGGPLDRGHPVAPRGSDTTSPYEPQTVPATHTPHSRTEGSGPTGSSPHGQPQPSTTRRSTRGGYRPYLCWTPDSPPGQHAPTSIAHHVVNARRSTTPD